MGSNSWIVNEYSKKQKFIINGFKSIDITNLKIENLNATGLEGMSFASTKKREAY